MSNESVNSGKPPQELLDALSLKPDNWDVIIVGDGSGSRWGYPGGWAAILFDRRTGLRKTLYGALSDTTVNICELCPYLYAMQWFVRGPGRDLQKDLRLNHGYPRTAQVHILTDCEVIAKQGQHLMDRSANGALWAAIEYYSRLNYRLNFTWQPRDQIAANRLCDALSKDMRHLITSIEQRLVTADIPDAYNDQFGQVETQV